MWSAVLRVECRVQVLDGLLIYNLFSSDQSLRTEHFLLQLDESALHRDHYTEKGDSDRVSIAFLSESSSRNITSDLL
jgi:hypothetical protein